MAKTTIYLVRHCEYENPKRIVPFRLTGFPLSAEGKKKAELIATYFKNKRIAAIYSSSILRTKQTARVIASELGLKTSTSLFLIETGTPFQGMSRKKFSKIQKDIFVEKRHIQGGGESIEEIYTRMKKFIDRVLTKHCSNKVIVVSHGDPLMIYTVTLIEEKVDGLRRRRDYIPKGGILKLVFDKDKKLKSYSRINY